MNIYECVKNKTKNFDRPDFVKEIQMQINENRRLSRDLKTVQRRLQHLLISNTISMYDRYDPKTKDYMYDITKFDDLYENIEENKQNLTIIVTLNEEQMNDINNQILEVKNDYESRINNTIDYVKYCLEHSCTVDEIEILNKLGYNKDTEE